MRHRSYLARVLLAVIGIGALVILGSVVLGPQKHPVRGHVVDDVTGQPVQSVRLYVGRSRWKTDAQGDFELSLKEGVHEIDAVLEGYVSQILTVTVTSDGATETSVGIVLPHRTLCGTVVDGTTGAAVPGVEIETLGQIATTDGTGAFCLDALALGNLQALGRGYLPTALEQESVQALFDDSGRMSSDLTITLEPRGISGLVTDARTGAPVAEVVVSTALAATVTDSDGRYTLAYVEPGVPIKYSSPEHRTIEVVYDGQSTQDVVLEPWHLTLTVTDADTGAPMEAVTIHAGEQVLSTDQNGQSELSVPAGTPLTISREGYRSINIDYAGEEELTVALEFSRVSGNLTDIETGQPVSGGLVQVFAGEPEPLLVRSDDQGHFVIEDVTDVVSVTVKAAGYARVTLPVTDPLAIEVLLTPFHLHAVYVPFGLLSVPERVYEILDLVEQTDLNGIVVDVKGDWARVAWDSSCRLVQEMDAYADWGMELEELLAACRERGLYTVARIVVFKDDLLAVSHPEWAVKRPDGSLYTDNEGLSWTDPFRQPVRDYNIALATEVALMGFDEVQMDYLRFPSDGSGVLSLVYSQEASFETRTAAMAEFCAQMYKAISRTPAFLSADVFGLTVWVDPSRDMGIGQRVDDIAPYVDYISPMLYPTTFVPGNLSHLGFDPPALYPYNTVYYSVLKTLERTHTKVRPWLQYYSIGGYGYDTFEYLEQRKAVEDAGGHGWMFWNARGRYEPDPFAANAYDQYADLASPPPPREEEPS